MSCEAPGKRILVCVPLELAGMWYLKFDFLLQNAIPWSRKVGPDGFLLAVQLSKKSFEHRWGPWALCEGHVEGCKRCCLCTSTAGPALLSILFLY